MSAAERDQQAMPAGYSFRPAGRGDVKKLVEFQVAMAEETEGLHLDRARVTRGVEALLDVPARGCYFVAEHAEDGVVACLGVTYEWSDWRCGEFWWIQSVFVDAHHRRKGLFRSMYRSVERVAREATSCCGLRLYVERENERAQATYASVGMSRANYVLFEDDFVLGGDREGGAGGAE